MSSSQIIAYLLDASAAAIPMPAGQADLTTLSNRGIAESLDVSLATMADLVITKREPEAQGVDRCPGCSTGNIDKCNAEAQVVDRCRGCSSATSISARRRRR
ncbi:Hypothetical protein D9617_36g062950 [Elsinoe fawcettii]|nr:Hypothetical protein D9617_36g062950 [Elsinoe fawcettii]